MSYPKVILQCIFEYLYIDDIPGEYYNIILSVRSWRQIDKFYCFKSCRKIVLYNNNNLTNNDIRFLPLSLVYLDLNHNRNFTDDCMRFLPNTLKHLNISHNYNFTNACIANLPRNLEYLKLSFGSGFTNKCIKDFPTSLLTLVLQCNYRININLLQKYLINCNIIIKNN